MTSLRGVASPWYLWTAGICLRRARGARRCQQYQVVATSRQAMHLHRRCRGTRPQDANGGHNLMAHATVEAIARELAMLSSCLCCPTLRTMQNRFPYHRNHERAARCHAERLTEQAILNGFRNVILMGDHAGGQPQVYEEVANKLNATLRSSPCVLL